MAPIRVGMVGASGETGRPIVDALLELGGFEIIALTRPSSLSKAVNKSLADKGVELRPLDLSASHETLVSALKDVDILISAIVAQEQLAQIPLATAAKEAGVKRFLPCAYLPVLPVGLHPIRDDKETVFNHVKRLGLPYTIVDVGWWYQLSLFDLPSGKLDDFKMFPSSQIPGDGTVMSALTHTKDVGRYIARIVTDERTLNKYVFVYNELWSQNQIYELMEKIFKEKLPRTHVSRSELESRIAAADKAMKVDPTDFKQFYLKIASTYLLSWGIRGDNTPEYAKYLGYVTSKELYPDMEYIKFEDFVKGVLDGTEPAPYDKEFRDMVKASLAS